ncbi:MAG: hypothetical protein A3F46_04980 [Legionellales bacterium RIFCSPHIGHO2_12_FULL_42_9]|nr:MAG: hypothetical protein A3F46_04980 [Legionellales bacterium RIFCSPHIGHO2_12_FULL_42_9]
MVIQPSQLSKLSIFGVENGYSSVRIPVATVEAVRRELRTMVGQTEKAKAVKDNESNGRGVTELCNCHTAISDILRNAPEISEQPDMAMEDFNSNSSLSRG